MYSRKLFGGRAKGRNAIDGERLACLMLSSEFMAKGRFYQGTSWFTAHAISHFDSIIYLILLLTGIHSPCAVSAILSSAFLLHTVVYSSFAALGFYIYCFQAVISCCITLWI